MQKIEHGIVFGQLLLSIRIELIVYGDGHDRRFGVTGSQIGAEGDVGRAIGQNEKRVSYGSIADGI